MVGCGLVYSVCLLHRMRSSVVQCLGEAEWMKDVEPGSEMEIGLKIDAV